MEITELTTANLDQLVALVLELWPDCLFNEELENYSTAINAADEVCYLAEEQGTGVAFIHLAVRRDYVEGATASPVAYIEAIYVQPHYQYLGIGKKLLKAGEDWSRQKGCRQLGSDTELNNAAGIAFHTSAGFEESNRVICFIKDL